MLPTGQDSAYVAMSCTLTCQTVLYGCAQHALYSRYIAGLYLLSAVHAGLGGVAPALQRLGITTAAQLQGHSAGSLAALLGGQQQARLAGRLAEAGWGRDEGRVADKGPPKSLQVGGTRCC
jgi:hypothetical protein